jgi:transposase-like protein
MSRIRKSFSNELKLKVALAYESGVSAVSLSREHGCHANLVYKWVREYRKHPDTAFRGDDGSEQSAVVAQKRIAELEQMVGRMTMELDFLKKTLKRAESASKNILPANGTV